MSACSRIRWFIAALLAVGGTAVAQPLPDPVARGRYLVETVAACGNCHTPQGPGGNLPGMTLAGGFVFDEPPFRAVSPNITPDPETGIGRWTDAQLIRAIREGKRPDGTTIGPPMPFELYRGLSDADVAAMVAYLRTVPPVRNAVARSEYRIPLPPAYGPPVGSVAAPADDPVARGRYIAGPLGHCVECHTPMGEGGRRDWSKVGGGGQTFEGPWGVSVARNITPHPEAGIGRWSDAEIIRAVTKGVSADGRQLFPPMGYAYYAGASEADLRDLVAYLRSLPPVP
ncbi:cytochrome C [Roseomonas sp. KE2513]|uniref:c-type cytochrome n=1 Tax=Roseomonas sp. KE2513 TaxID=2479202 RepID=UPI0018DF6BBD|nr:c-type cytochrome [Roseomonas sp. KE2513]MBI0536204.1 cytochrome C [Roseomonas sp. KE2513]